MTWPTSTEWMAVPADWTGYGYAAWIADLGPWEDVMPLPPPLRVSEAEEVDYWLSPMPASGDIMDFPDFANNADYFNTWAYNIGDGTYGSTTWATGAAIPGARVIVAVYPLGWPETIDALGPPPSDPPSWYAPHAYVPPPPPAPGEWQDCRFGLNGFTGWQADMGEYTGPWPLMSPALLDGAVHGEYINSFNYDGDDIAFIIALPNPEFPDDPNQALDSSYTTDLWMARRTFIGPSGTDPNAPGHSIEDWYTYHYPGNDGVRAPDGATPPPAGYHLYVVAHLASDNRPPHPPSFYTPSHYAPLGAAYAYTEAGGWSEWQPAYTVMRPALRTSAGGYLYDSPRYPPDFSISQQNSNGTSSASDLWHGAPMDAPPMGDGLGFTDVYHNWPPPYHLPSTIAAIAGWPDWLQAFEITDLPSPRGSGWSPISIFNAYTQYNALGYHSITTWFWLYMYQVRDGIRAQTNPVAPPDETDYAGPLVYGVDYIDPPFNVFPNYGGWLDNYNPRTDSEGLANMNGIGLPNLPDKFDHEHPKAIPEWVNIDSYLIPEAWPHADGTPTTPSEVSVGLGSSDSYDEYHQEYIDLWLGTPPLICKSGLEYNVDYHPSLNNSYPPNEYEWIDPIASGMSRIQQFSLEWTCNGFQDEEHEPVDGTIITPRVIGIPFGDVVPIGTERVTLIMQAHSTESEEFNTRIVDDNLPIPSGPHGLFDSHDVGSQSRPYYMKDFDSTHIGDPYGLASHYGEWVPFQGLKVKMHQPRWRYWKPSRIISNYVPPPPTLVASWSTL